MSFETLQFDQTGAVARITLNRPDAGNALNLEMAQELLAVANQCDEDSSIRAVIITGAGKLFCAGGDIASFGVAGDRLPLLIKEMVTNLHAALSRFARMDAPVIAAINGAAAGAGFSIAASADLALAGESAKFTMAYTAAGLSPDGSSTYYLPRLIGERRARELMLTNRRLSAAEAESWGLVNRVVADDALVDEAQALAASLSNGPTKAYGMVKKLLVQTFNESLETQMEIEGRGISDISRTEDAKAGIRAFLNKEKPIFKGR